jgi:hypothetical protein
MLTYDQQQLLVQQGLAKASIDEENRLVTFKYAKRVMFDYLWNDFPELLNCRGHVYCMDTKKLVTAAPTKTFNYLENNNWKDVPLDTQVMMYKKLNGFLCNVSVYKGKLIVSTTGTTTSDYAKLAREVVMKKNPILDNPELLPENFTWSFEICHPSDPHIVHEKTGAHYIGYRPNDSNDSKFFPTGEYVIRTLQEALEYVETDKGEGYMLYLNDYRCCKLKTPYYVGKKKLMRMNKGQVGKMYNNPQQTSDALHGYWKFAPLAIKQFYTKEEWIDKTDQQRRVFLENMEEYGTK